MSAETVLGNFEDKLRFRAYHILALPSVKWIILFGYTRIYSTSESGRIIKLTYMCLLLYIQCKRNFH